MKTLVLITCVLFTLPVFAQVCPGGGVNFSSAVMFDPAWIYGCNTGTSCNGGVAFDNRASCQPTTAIDACAPAPSCGTAGNNGSNIWFKFLPLSSTATISCFQNTSLVLGIQAFKGGPTCGSLIEIGCALAGGPSSGVQLHLSGLIPGQLYYYRIFGSSGPPSQRTGLYCFCGTTGLVDALLPVFLMDFKATSLDDKVNLQWTISGDASNKQFEIERSIDGNNFASIAKIDGYPSTAPSQTYQYTDASAALGQNFYRLKLPSASNAGHANYSSVTQVKTASQNTIRFENINGDKILVTVPQACSIIISNTAGQTVKAISLKVGVNTISTENYPAGIYFLRCAELNLIKRFYVSK